MDRLIYTALSGMSQTLERQSVQSNNLANASTNGFKGQLSAYRAVEVNGDGLPTRAITAETSPGADLSPGQIQETGRALDVAIDGKGWLAVQANDGSEAYTRNGNLQMDSTGVLQSGGRPVLADNGQPVVLPLNAEVSIASDGTISARQAGQEPNTIAQVATLKLVSDAESGMQRGGDGLFRGKPGTPGQPPAALENSDEVSVVSGALESSNVSPIEAMVSMIGDARQFEMQTKMLSSVNENDRAANQLLDVT